MSEIKINNIPVITENNGSVSLTTGTADIGNNALVVNSSGNVGIGTNSPSQTLTIYNGYDNQIKLQNGANANQSYEFGRNGSNGLLTFYGNQNGYTGYVFSGVDGERMRIDADGYAIFKSSLTNNTYIKGGHYYTFAANGSTLNIQPTTAFTALILVYDPGGGAGAAFLSTYQNSVVKIAGDTSWYDSDTAGNFCVFKSSNSHNSVTVKNNSIYVRNFYITVISTG